MQGKLQSFILCCGWPLLQVREGHNEAARYLLSKGADVTMVNDSGDSALTVANSPRMKRMIKGDHKDSLRDVCRFSMEYSETSNNIYSPVSGNLYVKRLFILFNKENLQ